MRRNIVATLSLAIMSVACVKEQEPAQEAGSLFLTAHTDDAMAGPTRTHLENGRHVIWDRSDAITVLGSGTGASWKFLPPAVVGFHGAACTFTGGKCDLSNGTAVSPESLYEQQLISRLGSLPAWLQQLK